ncbi:hypothetical protein JHK87_044666 [Glycine soja]|nr:hypothetical protein JHK87_044666 [Glycine soja]
MGVCSCICVTRCGWHILETQWCALAYVALMKWHVLETWWCAFAYVSLLVGGTYWKLSGVPLHLSMCHSLWVAHTGDLVVCSYIHDTYEVARTKDMVWDEAWLAPWWDDRVLPLGFLHSVLVLISLDGHNLHGQGGEFHFQIRHRYYGSKLVKAIKFELDQLTQASQISPGQPLACLCNSSMPPSFLDKLSGNLSGCRLHQCGAPVSQPIAHVTYMWQPSSRQNMYSHSDIDDLWYATTRGLRSSVEDSVLSKEKHHERMVNFCLDDIDSGEAISSTKMGLPFFPSDFPDCKAYTCFMEAKATAFIQNAELHPPSIRHLRVPILPPWGIVRITFNKWISAMGDS